MGIINRRRTYNNSIKFNSTGNVGDIAIFINNEILFVSPNTLNTNIGIPIGIVIIPTSHNIYEDGSCVIISLEEYKCKWGGYEKLTTLDREGELLYTGENMSITNEPIGMHISVVLPVDEDIIEPDGYSPPERRGPDSLDGHSKYYYDGDYAKYKKLAPSPYNEDGSLNVIYCKIREFQGIKNILYYMNGKENTETLVSLGTEYEAANYCYEYNTEGTNKNDWFLPSIGELGYICVRKKVMNDSIKKINLIYNKNYPLLKGYYWSSNEFDEIGARGLYSDKGDLAYSGQNNYGNFSKPQLNNTRAFLKIK